jgi:hypothetical protein
MPAVVILASWRVWPAVCLDCSQLADWPSFPLHRAPLRVLARARRGTG